MLMPNNFAFYMHPKYTDFKRYTFLLETKKSMSIMVVSNLHQWLSYHVCGTCANGPLRFPNIMADRGLHNLAGASDWKQSHDNLRSMCLALSVRLLIAYWLGCYICHYVMNRLISLKSFIFFYFDAQTITQMSQLYIPINCWIVICQ